MLNRWKLRVENWLKVTNCHKDFHQINPVNIFLLPFLQVKFFFFIFLSVQRKWRVNYCSRWKSERSETKDLKADYKLFKVEVFIKKSSLPGTGEKVRTNFIPFALFVASLCLAINEVCALLSLGTLPRCKLYFLGSFWLNFVLFVSRFPHLKENNPE